MSWWCVLKWLGVSRHVADQIAQPECESGRMRLEQGQNFPVCWQVAPGSPTWPLPEPAGSKRWGHSAGLLSRRTVPERLLRWPLSLMSSLVRNWVCPSHGLGFCFSNKPKWEQPSNKSQVSLSPRFEPSLLLSGLAN